ncbi:TerD family protein [Alkaliphilus sp. B6464]|uniref:TerD family protein n=1 Tax=Alkaliphilus sp. B6464 TaxID=2731219 RepID=UPI001BA58DD8|nr:TerD family protein [Alkaliphilus sp. B6464]QUH21743.1 TerD family protein [Alkaliphilus sp. B6464]
MTVNLEKRGVSLVKDATRGVTLQKNQAIDLTELGVLGAMGAMATLNAINSRGTIPNGINGIHVGLGWDVHRGVQADLDAFIIALDKDDKKIDRLYYGSSKNSKGFLTSKDGGLLHTGDNLTGEGDGDDEVMYILFDKLNHHIERIVVGVNIYSARLPFSKVENAFCRILDGRNGDLIARYDLSNNLGDTYTVNIGEFIKQPNGNWVFAAIGEPTKDKSIGEFEKNLINGVSNLSHTSAPAPQGQVKPRKKIFGLF